jgi:sporulation protein YlmC with PRC-barrel domain
MKARLCLIASVLLLAAPAFAQEPPAQTGTEPSAQAVPEPTPQAAPEPSSQAAPGPSDMAPAAEPAEKTATEPSPAPAAPAQEAAAPAADVVTDLSEVSDDKKMVQPWGMPVDSVEEMDIFDANGKKIGEVDAVLEDKNGEIKGVAIGYGGFLGFGEKGAVMTLDQLKLKDGTLVTEVSEDQLSQLPEWMK